MKRPVVTAVALCCLLPLFQACGADGSSSDTADQTSLTVLAASSLTATFGELETAFEHDHPDVDVRLSFDSSSTLATSVTEGAPADVLATADEASMSIVVDAGVNAAEPTPFASNTMAVVTPSDNPAGIKGLDDLAGTDFVLCDPSAPCGAVAMRIFANAGITAEPVSFEEKVTSVLAKVQLGEADAGLVYVSDARGAQDEVTTIEIPDDINVATPYYIVAIKGSPQSDLADEWISLVSSQAGQGVLAEAGFGAP